MISAKLSGPPLGAFEDFRRFARQRFERAALIATDKGANIAKGELRSAMGEARLGRLGQAIGSGSDLKKNGRVKSYSADRFSASGWLYVRSRSERTLGAIEAYTQGADIRPVRGRWLWIATDEISRLAGSNRQGKGFRMTPALYRANGFEKKIGPLVEIKGPRGAPVLIVRNVGVNAAGKKRQAKSLTKRGAPRKGQIAVDQIVAFYAIPRTSRTARVNVRQIIEGVQNRMPELISQALGPI